MTGSLAAPYLCFDHMELACLLCCVREQVRADFQHRGRLVVNDMRLHVGNVMPVVLLKEVLQLHSTKGKHKVSESVI